MDETKKWNNNLFIIGNGFDIAHGIKSKYTDFREWCKRENYNTNIFNYLFNSKRQDFWCDIEFALGNYDENSILKFCKPDEEFDNDYYTSVEIENSPCYTLKPALDNLKEYFIGWVNSIDLSAISPISNSNFELCQNAKYITFNFTETLETIYNIPQENICHIHGSRLSKKNDYIFGHNNLRENNFYDNNNSNYETNAKLLILEYMNSFEKPFNKIIKVNFDFFQGLKKTQSVYVLGHSLSEIDNPYFQYLLTLFEKQPIFYFSRHFNKDIQNIKQFINDNQIKNYHVFDF